MKAFKCDRCGVLYEDYGDPKTGEKTIRGDTIYIKPFLTLRGGFKCTTIDLCRKCKIIYLEEEIERLKRMLWAEEQKSLEALR